MPNQTKTIAATGGANYTSIQAFFNDADVSGGYWFGEIQDTSEYAAATLSSAIGTPTSANFVKLTVRAAERHSGVAGIGHARIRNTVNGKHGLQLGVSYTQIEHLQIQQDYPGSSLEGVRVNSGVDSLLLSRCIIFTNSAIGSQDGVYAGNWGVASLTIDNCIIYGWGRAGIHAQLWNTGSSQTWFIDSCTIVNCGTYSTSSGHGGISSRASDALATVAMSVYNTFSDAVIGAAYKTDGGYGAEVWLGSNNACTDASLTTVGLTVGARENLIITGVTQLSGNYAAFKNITAGTEDYSLLDDAPGNLLYGLGIDRVGSEPDARQDFTIDIAGLVRSASPDIGAHEYQLVGYLVGFSDVGSLASVGEVFTSQLHAVSFEGVTSAAEVDSIMPVDGVTYSGIFAPLLGVTEVLSFSAMSEHALSLGSLSVAVSLDSVLLSQYHVAGFEGVIGVAEVDSIMPIDGVTYSGIFAPLLGVSEVLSFSVMSEHALSLGSLSVVSQSVDLQSTQNHSINLSGALSLASVDDLSATAGYTLQMGGVLSAYQLNGIAASQSHVAAVNNLTSAPVIGNVAGMHDHALWLGNAYGAAYVESVTVVEGGLGQVLNPRIRIITKSRWVASKTLSRFIKSIN